MCFVPQRAHDESLEVLCAEQGACMMGKSMGEEVFRPLTCAFRAATSLQKANGKEEDKDE